MLVFILFPKKWILAYKPGLSWLERMQRYVLYITGFSYPYTCTVHTYCISGPETRHIPLHLLRRDRLGFCAPTQIRLFFGTVDQLKFLNLWIGDPLPSLTWFRDQTTPMQTEVERYALVLCRQFLFATGGEVFHSFLSFYCIQTTFTLPVH